MGLLGAPVKRLKPSAAPLPRAFNQHMRGRRGVAVPRQNFVRGQMVICRLLSGENPGSMITLLRPPASTPSLPPSAATASSPLENLALRHSPRRTTRNMVNRPKLRSSDRLFWSRCRGVARLGGRRLVSVAQHRQRCSGGAFASTGPNFRSPPGGTPPFTSRSEHSSYDGSANPLCGAPSNPWRLQKLGIEVGAPDAFAEDVVARPRVEPSRAKRR